MGSYIPGVDTTTESATPLFKVGQEVDGPDGSHWVYGKAGEAITQYMAVYLDPEWDAFKLTKAGADAGNRIGFAQIAVTSGYYAWFATKGGNSTMFVRLKNGCLPNVGLYTTATAGYLDDTSASQTQVVGIVAKDTATSSGAAEEVFISINAFSTATP